MSDRFQEFVASARGPKLVKSGEPADDPAQPDHYEAVRRIRSYQFADVVFRTHRGAAQAFPWSQLRSWIRDDAGRRLSFLWPEAAIILTGRNLHQFEEDVMRRIVAELRQVNPAALETVPDDVPVIETMEIRPIDSRDAAESSS